MPRFAGIPYDGITDPAARSAFRRLSETMGNMYLEGPLDDRPESARFGAYYFCTDPDGDNEIYWYSGTKWLRIHSDNLAEEPSVLHNSLTDLQGGTTDEYFHLTEDQWDAVTTNEPYDSEAIVFTDSFGNLDTNASKLKFVESSGLIYYGSGTQGIYAGTSDASDTGRFIVGGGGAADPSRGAYIYATGNEYTANEQGAVVIAAGDPGTSGTYDGMVSVFSKGALVAKFDDNTIFAFERGVIGEVDTGASASPYLARNAYHTGSQWDRLNTSEAASRIRLEADGDILFSYAAAAANPISWSDALMLKGDGRLGINTTTIPHGGVGYARLAVDGANASADGPHVQFTTASDDYPLMQVLNWSHDNVSVNFDMYFDGAWRSADAGSNFQIQKVGDHAQFRRCSEQAAGTSITGELETWLDVTLANGVTAMHASPGATDWTLRVFSDTAITNDRKSSVILTHKTTNTMVDGFAAGIGFELNDPGATDNKVAAFYAIKAGSGPKDVDFLWTFDPLVTRKDYMKLKNSGQLQLLAGVTGASPMPLLKFNDYSDNSGNPSVSHIDLYGGVYGFGISGSTLNYISSRYHRFYESGDLANAVLVVDADNDAVGINRDPDTSLGLALDVKGKSRFEADLSAPDAGWLIYACSKTSTDLRKSSIITRHERLSTNPGSGFGVGYGFAWKGDTLDDQKVAAIYADYAAYPADADFAFTFHPLTTPFDAVRIKHSGQVQIYGGVTGAEPEPRIKLNSYYDNSGEPSVSHIDLYGGIFGFGISASTLNILTAGRINFMRAGTSNAVLRHEGGSIAFKVAQSASTQEQTHYFPSAFPSGTVPVVVVCPNSDYAVSWRVHSITNTYFKLKLGASIGYACNFGVVAFLPE